MSDDPVNDALSLLDWRRKIAELYAAVRASVDPQAGYEHWVRTRRELFHEHPQSPVPETARAMFAGPHVYPYQPGWRVRAHLERAESARFELPTSTGTPMAFDRFARARFDFDGTDLSLDLYLLAGYGGGLFVPFADATSGRETYGAGRYLLDTVKGSDLGEDDGRLVLDFNLAYQPSCSYDPRWTCPLAPPANRIAVAVSAGERLAAA